MPELDAEARCRVWLKKASIRLALIEQPFAMTATGQPIAAMIRSPHDAYFSRSTLPKLWWPTASILKPMTSLRTGVKRTE